MTRKRRPPKTHYSLVHELFASDSAPMPAHTRRHQLTRMADALNEMMHAPPARQ